MQPLVIRVLQSLAYVREWLALRGPAVSYMCAELSEMRILVLNSLACLRERLALRGAAVGYSSAELSGMCT